MKRRWIGLIGGYVIIALLGMVVVLVVTAYLRAAVVRSEIRKADKSLAQGRPGAALGHLDRARKWAHLYPVLEKNRLLVAIRCHIWRMDIPRASTDADAVVELATYDASAKDLSSLVDLLAAKLVNVTALPSAKEDPLAAWDGYVTMIRELRRHGRAELLPSVVESISSRFPGGLLPPPVQATLGEGATKSAESGNVASTAPMPVVTAETEPSPEPPPVVAVAPTDLTSTPTAIEHVGAPTNASAPQEPPPAAEPVDEDPGPRWAITIRRGARAYDLSGQLDQTLELGSVIEITDVRDSSAGQVAVGRLAGTPGPSIAVPLKDLETYREAYEAVPAGTRELLVRRVCLQAEVTELRKRLTEDAIAARNPHAESYRAAKEAYVGFWKEAKGAQAKMEASTGDERMKHADTLRRMKLDEEPIRLAYESSKKANDAWMEANGDQVKPAASPELEEMEAELAEVKLALREL